MPSVELQDVPRESVDEHLHLNFSSSKSGPRSYGDEWRRDLYGTSINDDLDDNLARRCLSPSPSPLHASLCVFDTRMYLVILLLLGETLRVYEAQLPEPRRSFSPDSDEPMSDPSDTESSSDSPNAIARRRKRQQRQHERTRGSKPKKRMSIIANAWKEVSVRESVNPVGWYEGVDVDEKKRVRAPRYFRSEVGWYKDEGKVVSSEEWRKTLEESYIPQGGDDEEEEDEEEEDEEENEEEEVGEEDEEEEEEGGVDEDEMLEDEDEEGEIMKMEED